MELIPLIYTVLIIVFVLTVITIVSSFISHRKKIKLNVEVQPPIITRKQSPVQNKNIVHESQKASPPSLPNFEINKNMVLQRSTGSDRDTRKQITPQPESEVRSKKLKRGEILKNINPVRETSEKKNADKQFTPPPGFNNEKELPNNTLGDNIIDKYVDEGTKDFYTLNVKKNPEKKK